MNSKDAQRFYGEIRSVVNASSYPQQKYLDLGRILERIIRNEVPNNRDKNLHDCMQALFAQKTPGKSLSDRCHQCRQRYNAVKHHDANPTGPEYEAFVAVVLELVALYSLDRIPTDLARFVGEVTPPKPSPSEKRTITFDDLADNPTKRIPVVICLDTSGSMAERLGELKRSLIRFCEAVNEHSMARRAVELSLIEFNSTARCTLDYASVAQHLPSLRALEFRAYGQTAMGAAITLALKKLMERKQRYKDYGVSYHQPWLVIMTDGAPTDSVEEACRVVQGLVEDKALSTIPVGIGAGYNASMLQRLCSPFVQEPIRLTEVKHISEFFEFLRSSVDELL